MVNEWHILAEFSERSFVKETPALFDANIRERWATSKATQIIGSSCAKAARCATGEDCGITVGAAHKRNHEGEISPRKLSVSCVCMCVFIYRKLLLTSTEYLILPDFR